jgi:hypothetical protein
LKYRKIGMFAIIRSAAIVLVAQQSETEAPAGFTTPTLGQTINSSEELTVNPGLQSVSNGIVEPPGDTFALDQAQFERRHDPSPDWAPFSTRRHASIAITTVWLARPVSLPNSESVTMMQMATLSILQSRSTKGQTQ